MRKGVCTVMAGCVLLSVLLVHSGCATDPAAIPSYVRIDTIFVDSTNVLRTGSHRSKIDFAWVYVDDNLQGVYLLPAKFPVIAEGMHNIKVFGGVYEFGNQGNATRYVFYNEWELDTTLVVEDTLFLQPHVKYDSLLTIPYIENFDNPANFTLRKSLDSGVPGTYIHGYNLAAYEGVGGGYMNLNGSEQGTLIVESETPLIVPKNMPFGYFVELDYKCNTPFYFDIMTSQAYKSIVGFNVHTTWNKAYINITNAIDQIQGTDVTLIFKVPRDTNMTDQEVYIDNLKLIYR